MNKSVKILSGILGFITFMPGLAKSIDPFKTFIYQHLEIINFPFPYVMQYVVRYGQMGVGLTLIFLAFRGETLTIALRKFLFNLSNIGVIVMMVVAIYTHLHPDVPAEILPMEFKPPVLGIGYIILVIINIYLNNKKETHY